MHIQHIKLLRGSHPETAQTGQGCFMNVIAYLNGEPQITDRSECVCVVVRPIAIWLNDYLRDEERHILVPLIERAMGSATNDKAEILRRATLAAAMAKKMAKYAAEYAKYAAEYAESAAEYAKYAKYAAEYAESAAEYAEYAKYAEYAESAAEYAKYAAEYAKYAAEYAEYAESAAIRKQIINAAMEFLDEALPKAPTALSETQAVTERAARLLELAGAV